MEVSEPLCGRKRRTPLCWLKVCDREMLGPKVIHKTRENKNNSRKIKVT